MAILTDENMFDKIGKRQYASYYSGTDVRIYFGDKWVDEIVEIEWTMQEQLAPIYGFASYTWDKVARGNRYVQGSFVINFKEVGYLQTILNSLSSEMKEDIDPFNAEKFQENHTAKHAAKAGNRQQGHSVDMVVSNFEALAETYEDALWGSKAANSEVRENDTYFYSTSKNPGNKALKDNGFSILLTFGQTGDQGRGMASRDTAQRIVGVQLTGMSQRIDPSGNPVAEVYSFLAKDITGGMTLFKPAVDPMQLQDGRNHHRLTL